MRAKLPTGSLGITLNNIDMNHSVSESKGVLRYSRTEGGIKLYEAKIETVIYDHSPRNPSLPVRVGYFPLQGKSSPTQAYGLTYDQAITHIRSFGFSGEIELVS